MLMILHDGGANTERSCVSNAKTQAVTAANHLQPAMHVAQEVLVILVTAEACCDCSITTSSFPAFALQRSSWRDSGAEA